MDSQDLAASAICSACLEEFRDARLLPCLHSFCRVCIERLAAASLKDELPCPLCRAIFRLPDGSAKKLPKDVSSGSWSGVNDLQFCVECSKSGAQRQGALWCTLCERAYCDKHAIEHAKAARGHALSADLPKKGEDASTGDCCPEHSQPLAFYCFPCDATVCGHCTAVGRHNGHQPLATITEIVHEKKVKIAEQVYRLRTEALPRVARSAEAVERVISSLTQRADEVRTEIEAAGKRAVDAVEKVVQQKLVEVDCIEEGRSKVLNGQQSELRLLASGVENAIGCYDRFLSMESTRSDAPLTAPARALGYLQTLEKRLAFLNDTAVVEAPQHHPCLSFHPVCSDLVRSRVADIVGNVVDCQASAAHSSIRGITEALVVCGDEVRFRLVTKNSSGETLATGGDMVTGILEGSTKSLEEEVSTTALNSPVVIRDNHDGSYVILCKPTAVGEHVLKVWVNTVELSPTLKISCYERMTFDPDNCQKGLAISADRCSVSRTDDLDLFFRCVLGKEGMSRGQRSWKVKLSQSEMSCVVGVATKPAWTNMLDGHLSTYGWNCHGTVMTQWYCGEARGWGHKDGDVLQFELNCDEHTLTVTSLPSGDQGMIRELPDSELFPFVSLFDKGGIVAFVD